MKAGRPKGGSSRLLLVGDLPPPVHGQSVSFQMLCAELPRRGFDCHVIDLGRRAHSSWSRMSVARAVEMVAVLARIAAALAKGYRNVYLLIAQSAAGFIRDAIVIWGAWLCRCSVVVHLHGGNYDGFYRGRSALGKFAIRHTLRRTSRIIALSERLRGMYSFDPGLDNRVVVVSNGPPCAIDPKYRRREKGQPVKMLYLSNLILSKGYLDVLDAMVILKHEMSLPIEATFAGRFDAVDDAELSPAEAEAAFIAAVEASGLQPNVHLAGPASGTRKHNLLNEHDFFLLPTNYPFEGQPISIIEAMAHGCVVVATDYRAIPDMVVDGETGVLVDYQEPRQIADAVHQLANDPARYAAMSKAAAERYDAHFRIEHHLDAMVAILQDSS